MTIGMTSKRRDALPMETCLFVIEGLGAARFCDAPATVWIADHPAAPTMRTTACDRHLGQQLAVVPSPVACVTRLTAAS